MNETFRVDNNYEYEIWSDGAKALALHYGAVTSPGAFFADRVSVLLDANGYWVLNYNPVSDFANPDPSSRLPSSSGHLKLWGPATGAKRRNRI